MRWALALLISTTAAAEPLPTIDSTFQPTIRIVHHELFSHPLTVTVERGEVTWLTFDVTRHREGDRAEYTIDLPTGTRIVGMSFTDSTNSPLWSSVEDPTYARDYLGEDELAVTEFLGTSADQDHFAFHAVTSGKVSLALELPALPSVRVVANGITQTTFAPIHAHSDAAAVAVDTSLVIAPKFTPMFGGESGWESSADLDKAIIRRHIRFHRDAMRQCFMHQAQLDKRDNAAELELMILPDGSTVDIAAEVEHDGTAIERCLVDEIATWQFPVVPTGGRVVVNYPVTFKLDR